MHFIGLRAHGEAKKGWWNVLGKKKEGLPPREIKADMSL